MKKEFFYPSCDKVTQIHAVEWIPRGQVKAVLQLCHGMVEYIDRYDEFARFLAERGIYVTGHDHLGHGKSVASEDDYGFFHETEGNKYVIGDIHKLRQITEKKYPDIPYVMLGHSMGSFLLRQYLTIYSANLAGAVIMGTGWKGGTVLAMGQLLCRLTAGCRGWKYRSRLVNNLSFGSYNRKFEPGDTNKDWITSDKEKCTEYVKDPLCNFMFTVSGYYQMFEGMKVLTKAENTNKIQKNLPMYFVAGADDPVGSFGKGVVKAFEHYKKAGIRKISMKLYEGDRHEILNETDREQVYEDIYSWFTENISV